MASLLSRIAATQRSFFPRRGIAVALLAGTFAAPALFAQATGTSQQAPSSTSPSTTADQPAGTTPATGPGADGGPEQHHAQARPLA